MGLTANELSPLQGTGGSNPLASATRGDRKRGEAGRSGSPHSTRQLNIGARSSTDRASDYGSEGWGFESLRARPQKCRLSCTYANQPPSTQGLRGPCCHEDVTIFIELVCVAGLCAARDNLPK